ncbi:MAG: dihydroxyacetone kinase subunit DhaL [Actinomycetota bacterium]|nr:dihydroxyacetone kinase subunit DhaL [Actinomycetota bacterium]MDH5224006.1 dihydroxyacetone kinase subunit DhaL [Actinomycetota bacterium]MDH5312329.1 dihydroxyacetone kinase subunit DhaL [Actinomycetota bacterium]
MRRWVRGSADEMAANRDFLTQLDAAIGDADHGVNMDRGFSAAVIDLDATTDLPPGELLIRVGGTLIYRVGGAAGPLYGTCLRRAGESLGDAQVFDGEALLTALRVGLGGIQKLGAAEEGDKTIVDAYAPALTAFERELRAGGDAAIAARKAVEAARDGMRATVPMQARKGRASYLGPRSVGHQDPGATSTASLFAALAGALDGER